MLCCDEKSQCQALERTQPGLPLAPGRGATRTHDYKRHGTVTLFAALSYLDGKTLSQTAARHTHAQWLDFLRHLHRETPAGVCLHLIVDNYATHKPVAARRTGCDPTHRDHPRAGPMEASDDPGLLEADYAGTGPLSIPAEALV